MNEAMVTNTEECKYFDGFKCLIEIPVYMNFCIVSVFR